MLSLFCWLSLACNNNREQIRHLMQDAKSGLVQDKQVGDTKVRLTYLPLGWEKLANQQTTAENANEMAFRVNIFHTRNAGGNDFPNEKRASDGIDTLFQLVLNEDTLAPVSAGRITNGDLSGITYLVIFKRERMLPMPPAAVIFKDGLFTNTRLVFPLEKKYMLMADSLSRRL